MSEMHWNFTWITLIPFATEIAPFCRKQFQLKSRTSKISLAPVEIVQKSLSFLLKNF